MLKVSQKYSIVVSLVLLSIILISGCGGDSSNYSGVIATATPPPVISSATATPVPTVMSDVSGYVYNITSTDPEGTNGVIITDVPVNTTDSAGNASLISQVSTYMQSEEPTEWATSNCQEAYSQLITALSGCQPATGSSVTSSYSDPNSSGLSVNAEGYFSGQLPVVANQSNVDLEVSSNEDDAYDVETITSSGLAASSTSGLECCPKRIIALPGDIALFEVCSSENLKTAKLSFTLNNTSIGYVSPPVYLCVFGKNKYTKAYGFIYFKRNLTTPIDTIITAKTNTGLSLDIPVEVVKSTASISGKVFVGNKQLIKGYVKSLGPKAYCKLDSAGNYSLPKVYRGHDRKVCAVWYTLENGKKVKHKQVKVIDFFNGDVSGFNFGEEATPTPIATPTETPTPRPPWDSYYNTKVSNVIYQINQWEKEGISKEETIQKTIDWLNGNNQDLPKPEGISKASKFLPYNEKVIWIDFDDGMGVSLNLEDDIALPDHISNSKIKAQNSDIYKDNNKEKRSSVKLKSTASTVRSANTIILDSFMWNHQEEDKLIWEPQGFDYIVGDDPYNADTVSGKIGKKLEEIYSKYPNIKITRKLVTKSNFEYDPNIIYYHPRPPEDDPNALVITCKLRSDYLMVRPDDFKHFDQYGIIYIDAHSDGIGIECSVLCENDTYLKTWMGLDPNGTTSTMWHYGHENAQKDKSFWYINFDKSTENGYYIPVIMLTPYWIGCNEDPFLYDPDKYQDFKNSLVFLNCCMGSASFLTLCFHYENNIGGNLTKGADFFIGPENKAFGSWTSAYAYHFFYYMINHLTKPICIPGFEDTGDMLSNNYYPMSAKEAYDSLKKYNVDPDPLKDKYLKDKNGKLIDGASGVMRCYTIDKEIYFPAPAEITVKK